MTGLMVSLRQSTARQIVVAAWSLFLCAGVPRAAPTRPKAPPATSRPSHTYRGPWDAEAKEYLGTPQTERAVERALAYLAKNQNADGSWTSSSYTSEVGIVGLCALAFLSAGHQPDRGKYGRVLARATEYIANSVQRNGLIYNLG